MHPYVRPVYAAACDRWPRWVPRHEFQTSQRPLAAIESLRIVSYLGSIDRYHLLSLAASGSAGRGEPGRLANLSGGDCRSGLGNRAAVVTSLRSPSASRRCGPSCWRAPPPPAWASCAAISASSHGECLAAAAPGLLDHGGGAGHQHGGARPLIAGPGDLAKPGLAGGGMILGRQADPGGKIAAGPERLRIGRFHHQCRGTDRPDAGICARRRLIRHRPVPVHQLGLDRFQLALAAGRVIPALLEQTARGPARGSVSSCAICANKGSISSSPLGAIRPYSAAWPRIVLVSWVRRGSVQSRTPTSINAACWSCALHRHKPHVRPVHRLAQRFRIRRVVLVPLHVALHLLRRDQLHRMTELAQAAAPNDATPRMPRSRSPPAATSQKTRSSACGANFLRSTTSSAAFTPCSSKIYFDVSIPMRLICFTDGSLV